MKSLNNMNRVGPGIVGLPYKHATASNPYSFRCGSVNNH